MKDFYQHEVIDLINEILYFSKKTSLEQEMENWSIVI